MSDDLDDLPPELDDAELLGWLDERLSRTASARVEALLRRSAASRALLFDLARGPSADFLRFTRADGTDEHERGAHALDYHLAGPYGGVRAAMSASIEADDEPPLYAADGMVDVILRPGAPLSRAPAVAVFRARADGPLEPLDVAPQVAPGGAMRLRAPAAQVFGAPGRYALCLGIGAVSPDAFAGCTLIEARGRDPDVRWLSVDVFFDPAA